MNSHNILNTKQHNNLKSRYNKFASYYMQNDGNRNNIGLYGGISGDILFFYNYYTTFGEKKCINKIEDLIDKSLAIISDGKFLSYSFSSGLAGWAWTMQYLANKNVIDDNIDDFLKEIDEVLYTQMKILIKNKDFDQLNGAIGIARYFLYRKKNSIVIDMINFLDNEKITINNEIRWKTDTPLEPGNYVYNLSFAHGSAGILSFLTDCYKSNIKPITCKRLIKGSINFLINSIQEFDKVGSFFPNTINVKPTSNINEFSRLAWCYGDLGIFYALYQTSVILKDTKLQNLCLNGLLKNTQRKGTKETMVFDAGFCHGSSGNAYIFFKMYLQTKHNKFKESALFWIDKTIEFGSNKELFDYSFKLGTQTEPEQKKSNNFLVGSTGIAMVYSAFLSPKDLDWDYIVML